MKIKEVDLELEEGDVNQALNKLCDVHPGLKKELFDDKGEVSYSVNIFVNDKPITALKDLDTALKNCDEILIFMPVGGG
jgi:molybdopterin converting factor small subunit